MKTLVFNKKSWHYRLATEYGQMYDYAESDLCSYIRHCLKGVLACVLLIFMGVVFGVTLMDFLLTIGFFIGTGFFMPGAPAIAVMLFSFVGLIWGLGYFAKKGITTWAYERERDARVAGKPKTDSFILAAYRKFKNKTCMKIEFAVEHN